MAAQSIRSGAISHALVIGSETMSRVLNWQDRGTCILFGDGAGAVVLERSTEPGGVLSGVLRSDGSGGDLLGIPSVGSIDVSLAQIAVDGHRPYKMHMSGGEVFKFATRVIGDSVRQACTDAGITLDELALIVPHQANLRIIDAAARALGVNKSLFMCNLDRYGNTSSASIPIALAEAEAQGRIKPGDYVAMVGFGGGLTWAAAVVQWTERQAGTRFGTPRRQFSYTLSSARSTARRIGKRYSELLNRVRPERGRMERLRRRIEKSELE
jgi:3-oxoacyl-[acyl-carrier-protein] synthase-3